MIAYETDTENRDHMLQSTKTVHLRQWQNWHIVLLFTGVILLGCN